MKKTLTTLLLTACIVFTPNVFAKDAQCKIIQNGTMVYNQACQFNSYKGGSFMIQNKSPKKLIDGRVAINVEVIQTNVAEVRGLTVAGFNSLWGTAIRSTTDKACWIGDDFEICAY